MLKAMLFDLDGVLVDSERLKATAYATAIQKMCGYAEPETRAVAAYREIVGAPREEASRYIIERLGIEADLRRCAGAEEPWQALTRLRVSIYRDLIRDDRIIRDHEFRPNTAMARKSKRVCGSNGLASNSSCEEIWHILRALRLDRVFDAVLGSEDVHRVKPDPEIYLALAEKIGVRPDECLVLEDSANGVRAALAAGMHVIGFANEFTAQSLRASGLLAEKWITDDPEKIDMLVEEYSQKEQVKATSA